MPIADVIGQGKLATVHSNNCQQSVAIVAQVYWTAKSGGTAQFKSDFIALLNLNTYTRCRMIAFAKRLADVL
jgi:hypothetical protein